MQSVNLNMIPGSVMPVVNVTQFDEGREFGLTILNGTSAASLSGATFKINGRKQDDKGFSYDQTERVKGQLVISVSGNVVTIRTTKQMTAVKGDTLTTLEIMFSTQDICTLNFILRCQENPLADVDISETDIPAIIDAGEQAAERAETAAASAEASAETASTAATNAGNSARAAATSATNAATSETNAAASEQNAATSATYADTSADEAEAEALKSEGFARGTQNGTAVSSDSPYYHDNSAYWAAQAAQSASEAEQYAEGGLIYKGSITFAQIPTTDLKAGNMYNMDEDFTTDSRFQEGAGIEVKAGTNIAWNGTKWDLLAVGGVGELSGLSDVNITSAANKQGLVYDSTTGEWKNVDVLLKDGSVAADKLTVGSRASGSTVGTKSFAQGDGVTASGQNSHAQGASTTASSYCSHAEGSHTNATNEAAHAEGGSTTASGMYSHAEGGSTKADGRSSHSEGYSVPVTDGQGIYAGGKGSHAEGYTYYSTTFIRATGDGAHAEGYGGNSANRGVLASGIGSHSEGTQTTASGDYSHAEGLGTIAGYQAQHACGKYNSNKSDTLLEVGKGTADNARSNAFEVTSDGYIRTKGRTDKIAFGVDSNGNYGYIKAGADTVIPFSDVRKIKIRNFVSGNYYDLTGPIKVIGAYSFTIIPLIFYQGKNDLGIDVIDYLNIWHYWGRIYINGVRVAHNGYAEVRDHYYEGVDFPNNADITGNFGNTIKYSYSANSKTLTVQIQAVNSSSTYTEASMTAITFPYYFR